MDLITSPTRHLMPMFPSYEKPSRENPTLIPSAADFCLHEYALPSKAPRPSPRSFNTYPTVDQAPQWNNNFPRLITSFPNPSIADPSEHSLRRKTPNGTIDNGYDGTPTQLAGGPQPQKYRNLTPLGDIFPQASSAFPLQLPNNAGWYNRTPALMIGSDEQGPIPGRLMTPGGGGFSQGNMVYSPMQGSMLPSPSVPMHSPMSLGPGMRSGFGNAYSNQAVVSPSVMSPLGFNVPHMLWTDSPLSGFHPGAQMSTCYPPHNIPYESGFVAVQAPLPQIPVGGHGYGQNSPFHMPYIVDDGFTRHAPPSMLQSIPSAPNLPLGTGPMRSNGANQPNFRDSVLASAHRAFLDMVAHTTRFKKAQHGRASSKSLKNIIFPRPPKHLNPRPSTRSHQTFPGTGYSHLQIRPTNLGGVGVNMMDSRSLNPMMLPSAQLDASGRPFGGMSPVTAGVNGNTMSQFNPRSAAKASLEMLTTLCEQSEWKWIDGMLMGGCLQYSLDNHEQGLDWFKKILELDPK